MKFYMTLLSSIVFSLFSSVFSLDCIELTQFAVLVEDEMGKIVLMAITSLTDRRDVH